MAPALPHGFAALQRTNAREHAAFRLEASSAIQRDGRTVRGGGIPAAIASVEPTDFDLYDFATMLGAHREVWRTAVQG